MLKLAQVLVSPDQAPFDFEALERSIRLKKTISPKIDGRIKRLDRPATGQRSDCPQ
jgi:hypothetical protein